MEFRKTRITMARPLAKMPLSRKWVFDGLIRQVGTSTLIMVHGKEKVGKTWLIYDMALSLASKMPFMGKYTPSSTLNTVAIFSPEGGLDLATERLWGLVDGYKLNRVGIIDKLLLADLDSSVIDLSKDSGFRDLKEAIETYNIDVLIIDPIIEFYSLDENDNSIMAQFFAKLRLLSESRQLVIIFTHHNRKGDGEARGASSILGKYDFCISLDRKSDSTIGIRFNSRNSKTPVSASMRCDFTEVNELYDTVKITYYHGDDLEDRLVNLLNAGDHSNVDAISRELCARKSIVTKMLKTSKFKKINGFYRVTKGNDS